jgi:truncated hemoglobin YjbI
MDNKRDLDYIKFKLEKLEDTLKEIQPNNTEEIPLINIKKPWDWEVPSFDGGGGTGGTGGTSNNAVRTAQRVGRSLGSFFSSVGSTGALNATADLGVGNLLGMSASDIIMALTDVLGGPATTPDDVDARNAMARLMDEQLKGLTPDEIVNALERIPTGAEFARLIERFFALYIHEQFNRIFYSRLEARVGKDKAAQYLKNGLHCIEWMLRDRVSQIDVQSIDWSGPQGDRIINGTMQTVFEIFTGGE